MNHLTKKQRNIAYHLEPGSKMRHSPECKTSRTYFLQEVQAQLDWQADPPQEEAPQEQQPIVNLDS